MAAQALHSRTRPFCYQFRRRQRGQERPGLLGLRQERDIGQPYRSQRRLHNRLRYRPRPYRGRSAREDGVIELRSEGFGIAEQIAERGYTVGGFDAYTVSSVYKGSGLSSSAAFEDAVGLIINDMFCDGALSPLELAIISQRAERDYFGKACGLMDQAVCAVGGLVSLDFAESDPKVTQLCANLDGPGLCMCITNTGGSHADLGDEYSAIPAEMRSVAEYFGQRVLRGLTAEQIISELPALRAEVGDRAVLRALHFVRENERVARVCRALAESDTDAFLGAIAESGRSSAELLQNVTVPGSSREQGVTLALALSGELLRGVRSAYRVHGGGFAGTVQALPGNGCGVRRGRMPLDKCSRRGCLSSGLNSY